jgi:putative transcriptional regulator
LSRSGILIVGAARRDDRLDHHRLVKALRVFGHYCTRLLVAAVAIVTPAAILCSPVLHAALPTEPEISGRTSFAGQLLIAAPSLRDPFDHAVILVVQHDRNGALGIVINRPLARRPIATLLAALGVDAAGVTDSVEIFLGGPVSPNIAFALHSTEYHGAHTLDIDGHLALSDAAGVLRDIGTGHGPKQSLIAFGYAGWTAGQLDDEIAQGAWVAAPENPALVFDTDRAKVWTDALALYKNEH